jgi:membrane-bound lytic murein transglycosylase MltF
MMPTLLRRRDMLLAASLCLTVNPVTAASLPTALSTDLGTWTDDFDRLKTRRVIRFLVPYSPTLFFQDRGTLYGTAVQAAQLLEAWVNKTFKTGHRPIVVALIPTSRDALFGDLLAGHGDVAAGDVTVTEDRAKRVAFTRPLLHGVKEILVTSAQAPKLTDADGLSGFRVASREGTTTYESLLTLNKHLMSIGKPPVVIDTVPATLEVEDMMEMVAAGLLSAVIVDDWIAKLWVTLIRGLMIQPQVVLREDADIAWAVRPNNPQLLAVLNQAIDQLGGSTTRISDRTAVYLRKLQQIHAATSAADVQRFKRLREMFERYGKQYGFDDLLLQAQSYQESRLRQDTRSHVGAIGLMQLMPATGTSMKVGDIGREDPNVHAGAKYMRQLVDRNFPDANFDEQNRTLFAFASYNAGPGAIARARKLAAAQGLDPNQWFGNVERVTAVQVGQEPVRYVRNIYKYFIAYKLLEEHEKQVEVITQGRSGKGPASAGTERR